MSDPAPHVVALETRYQADLSALREQAKVAGDRIVTGIDELRVLTPPPPLARTATLDRGDDPLYDDLPPPGGGDAFDLDVPLLDESVATDDDGIPIWSDPA